MSEQKDDLMYALYEHLVLDRKTPGQFRETFERGAINGLYNMDDVEVLEKKSLVSLSEDLIRAGIVCLDLTPQGRKYVEELLAA